VYDLDSDQPIRSVHVAGTLSFAPNKDTRLDVGLIKIQPGNDVQEEGFDCEAHLANIEPGKPGPSLEVGRPDRPIDSRRKSTIRRVWFEGMEKQSCPAIVCCGGRMDFHGAPMNRTWLKLGATAKKGDGSVACAEPITGWRPGD